MIVILQEQHYNLLCILPIHFQRPTCPLLDHTPSIERGTINDTDMFGDA